MKEEKICPICIAGANNYVSYCIKRSCAWWSDYANECSVPVIAEILSDSSICQTIFKTPQKEET